MHRLLIALLLAIAPAALGCTTMQPNTWTLPPKSAPPTAAKRECSTPLKIAVVPFRDARAPTDPSMGSVPWFLLGMFASPDWEDVTTYGPRDPARPQDYVHDDERMFAAVLQRDLENTGCFDVVAFDPRFPYAYDVVIGGQIVGAGKRVEAPLVPLPAWIGTITASALASRGYVVEAELWAAAPGAKPFLHYGIQGACAGRECGTSAQGRASGFGAALGNGYAPFIRDFRDYVTSRTPSFWQRVGEARFKRFARERDSELDALVAAGSRNPRCRDVYEEELTTRFATLAAIFDESATEEGQWAARSWERADEEVRKANEAAGVAFAAWEQEVTRAEATKRRLDAERDLDEARERNHGDGFVGAVLGILDLSSKENAARNARVEEAHMREREGRLADRVRQQVAEAKRSVVEARRKGASGNGDDGARTWMNYYASRRRPLAALEEQCRQ